ncbi:MAG: hypothetical protein ACKO85_21280 [Isosphaeraceae bacterium]
MSLRDIKCPDCSVTMQEGYLIDNTHYQVFESAWHPRPVNYNKFFGFDVGKSGGMKVNWSEAITITSYRCPQCGLLREYAVKRPNAE